MENLQIILTYAVPLVGLVSLPAAGLVIKSKMDAHRFAKRATLDLENRVTITDEFNCFGDD